MAKAHITQLVDRKVVPSIGAITVAKDGAPPRELTVFGLDFTVRKMDKFHHDMRELRANRVDASLQAILLDKDGKVVSPNGFVHYGQPKYENGVAELVPVGPLSRFHSTVMTTLQALPAEVDRIVLVASVHEAKKRKHHIGIFGSVTLWLCCEGDKDPLAVHVFKDLGYGNGSVVLGEVCRVGGGEWLFLADGDIVKDGLDALCAKHGVEVTGA